MSVTASQRTAQPVPATPPPPIATRTPTSGFWSTLWSLSAGQRRLLVGSVVCAALVGATTAVQPLVIKWIIDRGVLRGVAAGEPASHAERLRWALLFVALYFALSVVRMAIGLVGSKWLLFGIELFVRDLRSRIFRHVQGLCVQFHDRHSSGELYSYISGSPIDSLRQFLVQAALALPLNVVSFTIAAIMLVSFDPLMAGVAIVTVAIIFWVNQRTRAALTRATTEFMASESTAGRHLADMLNGIRAVKIYAVEEPAIGSFEKQMARLCDQGSAVAWTQKKGDGRIEGMQYVGLAVIYGVGAWSCIARGMQVGTFVAFIASIGMIMGPLMSFMQLNLVRARAEAGLARITDVLRETPSTPDPPPGQAVDPVARTASALTTGCPALEFRAVTFAYNATQPLFSQLSLSIPRGQSVALVGASGSGKSSFISLVLRLYDVQSGQVLVDGADVRDWNSRDLRLRFGVVPQEPFIFHATVEENVRLTRQGASATDVTAALEAARALEFVRALPAGAATLVGDGATRLSGGQRQRLAIARAVLAAPECYIFDEATSALDNESERQIQAAMELLMRGRTTIIIAHRLSTVRNVDRVLVFERGRIVQDGSYHALSARAGPFQDLLAAGGITSSASHPTA